MLRATDPLWEIHRRLVHGIGYGDRLTALDFMMAIGLPIVKPDILVTTLMVHWGWLQSYYDDVPNDLTKADLRGDGHYGGRYRHTAPFMHCRVIGLAKELAARVLPEVLRGDIGWVTSNPLREFALFLNKYAQKPNWEFGIEWTLFDGTDRRQSYHDLSSCRSTPFDTEIPEDSP